MHATMIVFGSSHGTLGRKQTISARYLSPMKRIPADQRPQGLDPPDPGLIFLSQRSWPGSAGKRSETTATQLREQISFCGRTARITSILVARQTDASGELVISALGPTIASAARRLPKLMIVSAMPNTFVEVRRCQVHRRGRRAGETT